MKRPICILTLAFSLAAVASRPARAEQRIVRYEEFEETVPDGYMLGSGIAVFGISYGAAAIVATTSRRSEDRTLLVPLLGPWLDLSNRPTCGTNAVCNDENTAKVLLVVNGIFQGVGAFSILGSFLSPEHRRVRRPVVEIVPTAMGVGGSGLMAIGRF
jgi:hypothetical protein